MLPASEDRGQFGFRRQSSRRGRHRLPLRYPPCGGR